MRDFLKELNDIRQAKIKDAKARQNAIAIRCKAAQTRLGVRRQLNDHNVDDAMQRFEKIQRYLAKSRNPEMALKSMKVKKALKQVTTLAPNHLSARYLLLYAVGKAPKALTLNNSLNKVFISGRPLMFTLYDY